MTTAPGPSRRRRLALGALIAGSCLAMLGVVVAVLNLTAYVEATVPPEDSLPRLETGLRITEQTVGCGSGSCYREFTVTSDHGTSARSVLDRLPAETCRANSLVDRRPRCTGYELVGGRVRGYVSIGTWWG